MTVHVGPEDFGVRLTAGGLQTGTLCVFVCPSWKMSSGIVGVRGSMASLFSCARAWGLNPAEALSHTHTRCDRGLFLKYTQ